MRVSHILFMLSCSILVSCKNPEANEDSTQKQVKMREAAGYNVQLGMAYLKQNDLPRAKRKLIHALEQAPDMPDANAAMGYYLEKTGDANAARSFFQKAMTLAPGSGAQMNNFGTFLCRQGEYKQAESYFLKASHDIQYANTASAIENAALCAMAIPDYSKAKQYFRMALKQDPKRSLSLFELVKLELKDNQYQLALDSLQKYPNMTLKNKVLLELALNAADHLGNTKLKTQYQNLLLSVKDNTGVEHEYDSHTG